MARNKDYRRHKNASKLKRRIEIYAAISWRGDDTRQDFRDKVMAGDCKWIRSTSTPCSCSMCTFYKYIRPLKSELKKIIDGKLPLGFIRNPK